MKYLLNILLSINFLASPLSFGATITGCKVKAVRRLNISNGVRIMFNTNSSCQIPTGSFEYKYLRYLSVLNATEANVSQLVTLTTTAMIHDLEVEIVYDNEMLGDETRNGISLNNYAALEITK